MKAARFIGEIGNNHQGDFTLAKRMVELLCNAGCWGVKSQKRDVESHPEWKKRLYSGPNSFGATYYQHRKVLELEVWQHAELKRIAESRGSTYFCSAWDIKSAEQMKSIGCDTIKIPSCYNSWWNLLDYCTSEFERVIISTGMTTSTELSAIFDYVAEHPANKWVVMLCTSSYPCHPDDVHLGLYNTYRTSLPKNVDIGFSGHHKGRVIDYAAYAIGCQYIERHVTMDVYMKGSDHAASMEIPEIMSHIRGFDKICRAMGDKDQVKSVLPCEIEPRRKLRDNLGGNNGINK